MKILVLVRTRRMISDRRPLRNFSINLRTLDASFKVCHRPLLDIDGKVVSAYFPTANTDNTDSNSFAA